MDDVAIRVEGVSKTFKLPHEKQTSVKGMFLSAFKGRRTYEKQQVLNNISFDIKKGEFFGIVGRNGSGKSTLLKLLAGIYSPDAGSIQVNGKLTPFIELGVGFNPELTGRENVFLNGALLGFNRKEMEVMYGEIVEFAELKKFMDQKLKNYSSGMQVRLAFSIAIQAKSDILVLDEVLAVGDESFQRKCLDIFDRYKVNKQTIVLVTHSMETVKKYCTNAILLEKGDIIAEGDPGDVADVYTRLNQDSIDVYTSRNNKANASSLNIVIENSVGKKAARFSYGDKLRVKLNWPSDKKVQNAGVAIYSTIGECIYATNTFIDKVKVSGNELTYEVDLTLGGGRYYVMAGTFLETKEKVVDFVTHGPEFSINAEDIIKGDGVTRLIHEWKG